MSKKISKDLIQKFLFMSPQHTIQRFKKITPVQIPKTPEIADQKYIQSFLSRVHCQFLLTNQFYHLQRKPSKLLRETVLNQYSLLHNDSNNSNPSNNNIRQKTQTQNNLLQMINKLSKNDNQSYSIYGECQEIILRLTAQQAYKNKKYLIYAYKIILNTYQIGKYSQQTIRLSMQIKSIIIQKIYEGHQTRVSQQAKVKQQLERIEILVKARNSIANGNGQEAKSSYQVIFEDENNDANVRMQALQYLCKKSQEKGDESYLLGMISKVKNQNGYEQRHRKFIQNVLNKLHATRDKDKTTAHAGETKKSTSQ